MPLQVDATLLYNQDPNTPFEQLKALDTPWNTYLHAGLPLDADRQSGQGVDQGGDQPGAQPGLLPHEHAGRAVRCSTTCWPTLRGNHAFATNAEITRRTWPRRRRPASSADPAN